jgi:hypothetical protein
MTDMFQLMGASKKWDRHDIRQPEGHFGDRKVTLVLIVGVRQHRFRHRVLEMQSPMRRCSL